MEFHFETVFRNFGDLLGGAWVTLYLSAMIMIFGSLIGLAAAFGRLSGIWSVRAITTVYIQFIRGTPLLVQLLYIFYGLPLFTGVTLSPIVSGVVGMSINLGAYISEVFRSGILAVESGQIEAGRSLGMSRLTLYRVIIGPQALRVIVPPLGNMFIGLVKDTSLLSVIAVSELVRRAELLSSVTFRTMETFTVIALMYFCMTYILAHTANILEARLSRGIVTVSGPTVTVRPPWAGLPRRMRAALQRFLRR